MADMKPIKLTIENINSLRGRHTIDFTAGNLAGCGLFAIIGPTGSGKTTILDAITLALYGQACRYGGKSSPTDVMTTNTAISEATLLFACGDTTYEASWRLRRARGAVDGALQSPEASLKRVLRDGSIEVIAEQVVKARAAAESILGLNFEQFQRVALLPQGEFDRFLTAKDDERTQILEKLTGTGKYREIGEAIRKAFKQAASASKSLRDNITGLQISLLEPDDLKVKTERLATLNVLVPTAKKEADDIAARAKSAADYIKAIKAEVSLNAELTTAQASVKAHQPNVDRLARFRTLKPVYDAKRDLAGAKARLTRAETDHKSAIETASQAAAVVAVTRAQVLRYGRETMRNGLITASRAAEAIGWQPFASISDAIAVIQPIAQDLNAIRTALPQVGRSKADAEKAWQLLWQKMTEVPTIVEAAGLDAEPETMAARGAAASAVERAYSSMLANLDDQVARERRTVDALIQSIASLSKVAELEQQLQNGKDCPLCRQIVVSAPATGTSATELIDANAKLSGAQTELKRLESRVNRAGILHASLTNDNGLIANWKAATARTASDASQLNATLQAVNLSPDVQNIANIDDHLAALINVLTYTAAEVLLRRVQADGRDANDVAAAEQPAPTWASMEKAVEVYTRQIDTLTKADSAVSSALEQVAQQTSAVKLATELYNAQLAEHQVANPTELDAISLTDNEWRTIESQRETLISAERLLVGNLQNVRQTLAILEAVQPPLPSTQERVDALAAEATAKRQASNNAIAEQSSLGEAVNNDAKIRSQLLDLERQLGEKAISESRWKLLDEKFGGDRLTRLVQRIGMDALLGYANQRLQSFSNRYQLRGVDTDGLGILVVDRRNLDATRVTSSLSGGEKFLTSLSLALGLSDIASRSARIDSLFIDEGFGTLDAETLETALSALQMLRTDTGRQVGIISHVGALQERLQARIVVQPNGDGTSKLVVT
jgi:exonuclease SbcC